MVGLLVIAYQQTLTYITNGIVKMSNSIYKEKNHYVYCITEIDSSMKYIGVRSCMGDPINDLGYKYFSSSKNKSFVRNQKDAPEKYKYDVLSIFDNREDAINEEVRLHELYDVGRNPKFYNNVKQTNIGFDTTGKVTVCDDSGNIMLVSINDQRYLSGELKHYSTGTVSVFDSSGNYLKVKIDDQRYLSGELKHVSTGIVTVKDNLGNTKSVKINDEKYISGELQHNTKGMVVVKDSNKTITQVSINDPRYISGELIQINTGRTLAYNKSGEIVSVYIDDEKYLSGEYVSINKNKVNVKDKDGNSFQVDKNDPRYLSGELVSFRKGKITVKDSNGIVKVIDIDHYNNNKNEYQPISKGMVCVIDNNGDVFQVDKNDPRYLSGELKSVNSGIIKMYNIKTKKYEKVHPDDERIKNKELIYKTNYIINDIFYNSLDEATQKTGVNPSTIIYRCKNTKDEFKEWILIYNF